MEGGDEALVNLQLDLFLASVVISGAVMNLLTQALGTAAPTLMAELEIVFQHAP